MKLVDLRRMGSQALDDIAEFILSENALVIYESNGNGDYHTRRVYKVIKATPMREAYIEMDVSDIDRLAAFCAGEDVLMPDDRKPAVPVQVKTDRYPL